MNSNSHKLSALSILKGGSWFKNLDATLQQELADLSVIRHFQPGETIFIRGEPGDCIYGIIAGAVRVTTQSLDGRELSLNTMLPGDIGGEIAALDGGVRTATGTALEATTVFVISRHHMRELMVRQPAFALHMIDVLCARVRNTSQQVEDAAFLSLPERLARQLGVMVEVAGHTTPCRIKISQRELASFLNASRQVVNGLLQEWQRLGLISVGRGFVEVGDLPALIEHAGSAARSSW